jgi:LemA protein
MGSIIFWGGLLLVVVLLVVIFNRLVALKNRFLNAFAQIDVQLKRRYDLIPNLVETARAYVKHERETLEAVIAARNSALQGLKEAEGKLDAASMKNLGQAEGQLLGALGKFQMVVEAYPDLKANTTMMQLSEELTSTENKISFSRQAYNDAVMEYNTSRQSFPAVIFAGVFGHNNDAALLEFADRAALEAAPKVSF